MMKSSSLKMSKYTNIDINKVFYIIKTLHDNVSDINFLKYKIGGDDNIVGAYLDFLLTLNIVKIVNEKYSLVDSLENNSDYILRKIVQSEGKYKNELFEYIMNFIEEDGQYIYKPDINSNFKYRFIRNFLSQIDAIRIIDNTHTINPDVHEFLLKSKQPFTLDQLMKINERKRKTGLEAENLILRYEADRLRSLGISDYKPNHVAMDLSLGYDILSYDIKDKVIIKRFIEVKATSESYGFFWSKNELNVAKKFSSQYFLYLLPHNQDNFFIESLSIIKNPYHSIFKDNKDWNVDCENYFIFKSKE